MKKIIFERDKCIGCGTCSVICPVFWEVGDDGRANLKEGVEADDNFEKEVEDLECNIEAAQSCPVQCIHIKEN
jgi:ferredoxin